MSDKQHTFGSSAKKLRKAANSLADSIWNQADCVHDLQLVDDYAIVDSYVGEYCQDEMCEPYFVSLEDRDVAVHIAKRFIANYPKIKENLAAKRQRMIDERLAAAKEASRLLACEYCYE